MGALRPAGGPANFAIVIGGIVGENSAGVKSATEP
jgi:hypothetical protein